MVTSPVIVGVAALTNPKFACVIFPIVVKVPVPELTAVQIFNKLVAESI